MANVASSEGQGGHCITCGIAVGPDSVWCRRHWDGLHCARCGVGLAADTIWCDPCSGGPKEPPGLTLSEHLAQGVDNDVIRDHLRRYMLRLNDMRMVERKPWLTWTQARAWMLAECRCMLTLRETIKSQVGQERQRLIDILHRMIDQEARWAVNGYPPDLARWEIKRQAVVIHRQRVRE